MTRFNLLVSQFIRVKGGAEAFAVIPTQWGWIYLLVERGPRGFPLSGRARKVSPWVDV